MCTRGINVELLGPIQNCNLISYNSLDKLTFLLSQQREQQFILLPPENFKEFSTFPSKWQEGKIRMYC